MSQPPPEPSTDFEALGVWAGVILSVLIACGSAFRVFFGLVSRREMEDQLNAERVEWAKQLAAHRDTFGQQLQRQYEERIRMHEENRDTAQQSSERLSKVEQGIARIEGTLSGRYQGIDR